MIVGPSSEGIASLSLNKLTNSQSPEKLFFSEEEHESKINNPTNEIKYRIRLLNLSKKIMNLTFIHLIGIIFLLWMIYFSLGAFANMTENEFLLNIFKSFKYIMGVIILIALYLYIK